MKTLLKFLKYRVHFLLTIYKKGLQIENKRHFGLQYLILD